MKDLAKPIQAYRCPFTLPLFPGPSAPDAETVIMDLAGPGRAEQGELALSGPSGEAVSRCAAPPAPTSEGA